MSEVEFSDCRQVIETGYVVLGFYVDTDTIMFAHVVLYIMKKRLKQGTTTHVEQDVLCTRRPCPWCEHLVYLNSVTCSFDKSHSLGHHGHCGQ